MLNKYNYKSSNKLFALMNQLNIDACLVDVVNKVGNAVDNWDKLTMKILMTNYKIIKFQFLII